MLPELGSNPEGNELLHELVEMNISHGVFLFCIQIIEPPLHNFIDGTRCSPCFYLKMQSKKSWNDIRGLGGPDDLKVEVFHTASFGFWLSNIVFFDRVFQKN